MRFLLLILLFIATKSFAQCKTFKLSVNRDTLNCIDQKDKKQGKWVIKMPPLRGEPGYDEEGIFKDNLREGIWRRYSEMGDPIAIEQYRWGYKDGISQYYGIAGIVREESWKAVNPENPYDTIDVPDVYDQYKVERKIIKIEGTSVKHGTWKFYEPGSGVLAKSEQYFLDKFVDPTKQKNDVANGTKIADTTVVVKKPIVKPKPQAVADYEKKNSGKKSVKVRPGGTGL